jgi:hypothetical protein
VGFEPTALVFGGQKTAHALYQAATAIRKNKNEKMQIQNLFSCMESSCAFERLLGPTYGSAVYWVHLTLWRLNVI